MHADGEVMARRERRRQREGEQCHEDTRDLRCHSVNAPGCLNRSCPRYFAGYPPLLEWTTTPLCLYPLLSWRAVDLAVR